MITRPGDKKKTIHVNTIVLWFHVMKDDLTSFSHLSSPNLDTLIW